jgi:hypothetical protein
MMQICFNNSPANTDTIMLQAHDMVYQVEQIGEINVIKLTLLFIVHKLRFTHLSLHKTLTPTLTDGTITFERV